MTEVNLSGSCLCGKVKFFIAAELEEFYFCHCQQCRKLSGTAFASNILAKPSPIVWRSGSELIRRFDYPGERSFTRVFCGNCGSALPFLNKRMSSLIIPAGSLDSEVSILPDKNIFWDDKAPWLDAGTAAQRFIGFP
ncbi:GFA family protein [Cyanobium sp. PCC 7001]|uniref:GFA family protein n=1 Tax=Cyanobium sp. PCC 7001 TaxID=180281 RepID=UPI0006804B8C